MHTPRSVLVTGGAGFIGSNFLLRLVPANPDVRFVNLDLLTYAGHRVNLRAVEDAPNYTFVHGDIADADLVARLFDAHRFDTVVHFAAESHVDRSILDPLAFVRTNVVGTATLLEAARQAWRSDGEMRDDVRFHHVSTDEVFGALGDDGAFDEATPYDPRSPYSASKAGSDHLVRAYHHTYGLPVTLSNCSNNYGPFQYPEKLIPLVIRSAVAGRPLPVYGRGQNTRDWLHVEDHVDALDLILRAGRTGETYAVGGRAERRNLEVVETIADRRGRAARPRAGHGAGAHHVRHRPARPRLALRHRSREDRARAELEARPHVRNRPARHRPLVPRSPRLARRRRSELLTL